MGKFIRSRTGRAHFQFRSVLLVKFTRPDLEQRRSLDIRTIYYTCLRPMCIYCCVFIRPTGVYKKCCAIIDYSRLPFFNLVDGRENVDIAACSLRKEHIRENVDFFLEDFVKNASALL